MLTDVMPGSAHEHASIVPVLLGAYAAGRFPMGGGGGIEWYDPLWRGVFGLHDGGLRVSRTLRRTVDRGVFTVTADRAFGAVIRACAASRAGETAEDGWIDARIIGWYEALHEAGHAHSLEAWRDGVLVGGLYGVSLRGVFAGESMFSRPELGGTDASKVCLVHLWRHLRARGYAVLDCQFWTEHLGSLGAVEISRADYRRMLWAGLSRHANWGGLSG